MVGGHPGTTLIPLDRSVGGIGSKSFKLQNLLPIEVPRFHGVRNWFPHGSWLQICIDLSEKHELEDDSP